MKKIVLILITHYVDSVRYIFMKSFPYFILNIYYYSVQKFIQFILKIIWIIYFGKCENITSIRMAGNSQRRSGGPLLHTMLIVYCL